MGRLLKWLTVLAGLVMIATGAWVMMANPREAGSLPNGMFTPVIALEFVGSAGQLSSILDVDDVEALLNAFTEGNRRDVFFMASYSVFTLLVGLLMFLKARVYALLLCIPLSIMMFAVDYMENFHIAVLLDFYPKRADFSVYEWLRFYTWLKWGTIAAMMFLYAMYFLQDRWWMKVMALPLLSSFLTAIPAWLLGGMWLEVMALSIFAGFIMLLIYALMFRPNPN